MRLFVAIYLPEEIKDVLYSHIESLKKSYPSFKWVQKNSLHLTLKFLGETDHALAEQVDRRLTGATRQQEQIKLSTLAPGFFPKKGSPRIFFVALDNPPELVPLVHNIEDGLVACGFSREKRPFHPHITLARIKDAVPNSQEKETLIQTQIKSFQFIVQEIILMQSILRPDGAKYIPFKTYPLRVT